MEVTCIEQNQNSRYARLVASDQEVPGRCAKFGIENQDTARSGGKQFKCSRLINKLAFCYLRVEVRIKRFDISRYLAADLHIHNRVDRARGGNTRLDCPSINRHGL